MTVTVTIPRPPSTNNLFAGVGKRRVPTSTYMVWRETAGWELARQRPTKTLGKVALTIEVEEPRTSRRQDIDNKSKAPIDLLVTHGLIDGDDQFTVRQVTMLWSSKVEGARVTIAPWVEPWGGA